MKAKRFNPSRRTPESVHQDAPLRHNAMAEPAGTRHMPSQPLSALLTTRAAAKLLGVSQAYLERDRWQGGLHAIPFVRLSARVVRYRVSDLEAVIATSTRKSTAEG